LWSGLGDATELSAWLLAAMSRHCPQRLSVPPMANGHRAEITTASHGGRPMSSRLKLLGWVLFVKCCRWCRLSAFSRTPPLSGPRYAEAAARRCRLQRSPCAGSLDAGRSFAGYITCLSSARFSHGRASQQGQRAPVCLCSARAVVSVSQRPQPTMAHINPGSSHCNLPVSLKD